MLHTRKIVKLDASHSFDLLAIIIGLGLLHLYSLSPYNMHFFGFTSWELNLGNNE